MIISVYPNVVLPAGRPELSDAVMRKRLSDSYSQSRIIRWKARNENYCVQAPAVFATMVAPIAARKKHRQHPDEYRVSPHFSFRSLFLRAAFVIAVPVAASRHILPF